MKRLNSVVIKLWLTIILIVTTVLILLSAALITFIQYYFTQNTEQSLYNNAESISAIIEKSENRQMAINHSEMLLEGSKGVIILPEKNNAISKHPEKKAMLKFIKNDDDLNNVKLTHKKVIKHVTIKLDGQKKSYLLLGYPTLDRDGHKSVIYIYEDLRSISDTNNVIAIIILITAVIFLIISTIFAFFLSSRITNPLRQFKEQALEVAKGRYDKQVHVQTKDEIGELASAFNQMSHNIQNHIDDITSSKNIRDTLINSMAQGVLGINHKRHIILSNHLAHKMMLDMNLDHKILFDTQINDTFESQKTEYREYEINQKHYAVVMSYIDQIQSNKESGLVVIIRDMTREHHMEQMKKDFIASVSHELRTPISLLQGYTESIVDGIVTEPEDIHEFLLIVLDETKRLSRLVNELLDVAKIDADGINITKEARPMSELIQKMATKYRQQANELALTLDFQTDGIMDDQWDYDFDRMEQVLTNLVDNASRYTRPGDLISIQAEETTTHQILTVKDTGVGISPEHLERVFERFYKVDAARKRGKEGTGLGLFITRMIIEAHHGKINVSSEVGKGTTFTIKLPKYTNA
ncbi:HAMP domain-containing protein [Staphylococcus muscae]|uniref:Sensor protein SrrB n=1 Tax=Staphylococcus muscae TaxID=1294 RepID=A0A240C3U3_9STAP|nr:ATP-binding protein [Staphylococcus muscae]AVQ33132.1 HAMP domain-containing protein [Staphylococcus muscae]GGA88118.1 sensor protein SrrB [Staphylococcus muscae]SNW02600.1 signal transduction histidine kinase SsrB [Staphylococcus muscae]